MAAFISIFLAFVAALVSAFALYTVKKSSETGDNHLDEIMRLKQHINETNNRFAQLFLGLIMMLTRKRLMIQEIIVMPHIYLTENG